VAVDEATCLLPLRRVPMAHISTESLRATQDLARILVLSPEVGRQVHFSDGEGGRASPSLASKSAESFPLHVSTNSRSRSLGGSISMSTNPVSCVQMKK